MRSMMGSLEIDGVRCSPLRWSRFNFQRTTDRKLFRRVILDNSVTCTLPAPWTHRDLVLEVAKRSHNQIPIESLPSELSQGVHPRGRAVSGFVGNCIDQIASNYQDMQWWVSEKGLNMAIVTEGPVLMAFDEVAGQLMVDAQHRSRAGRIAQAEYGKIAAALDAAGFKPKQYLERGPRKDLSAWNQKHPNQAIHTFSEATARKLSWLNRGIKKRLYRAADKFKKAHP